MDLTNRSIAQLEVSKSVVVSLSRDRHRPRVEIVAGEPTSISISVKGARLLVAGSSAPKRPVEVLVTIAEPISDIAILDGATLTIGDGIAAAETSIRVIDGAIIEGRGVASHARIELADGATARLKSFVVDSAAVRAKSGSEVELSVTNNLRVHLSDGSTARIHGSPRIEEERVDDGSELYLDK